MFKKLYACSTTVTIVLISTAVFGQETVQNSGNVKSVAAEQADIEIYELDVERGLCQFPSSDGTSVKFLTIDDWDSTVASMVNLPGSDMKRYLQILPEQEQEIQELRSVAKKEFLKAIEGLRFCDDPRFPQVESQVMQISKKLNEQSRAILLPHQFEAWNEFLISATALQNGSVLNSVIEGSLSRFLSDKGRAGVAELRPIVREMILFELQELEKKATRELLRDESVETRDRIMKTYDALPPNWTPNFKALMYQGQGGLNGCTNCPPDPVVPNDTLNGSVYIGNHLSIRRGKSVKPEGESQKGDPKKEQSGKDGGDRPDKK